MEAKQLYDKLEKLGPWLDWEPETIRELKVDGKPLDEVTANQVLALQVALSAQTVDGDLGAFFYFDDWHVFEKIVVAFNGEVPDFADIEECEPFEIHRAINQFSEIFPVTFTEDVAKYIAASYATANIVHCPFFPRVDDFLPDIKLKPAVAKAWGENRTELDENDPVEIQIARLQEIRGDR